FLLPGKEPEQTGDQGTDTAGEDSAGRRPARKEPAPQPAFRQGVLRGHTQAVVALAVSADGALAASAADRTVRVWDLKTGKPFCSLGELAAPAESLAFSPDGRRLLAGGPAGLVEWDLRTKDTSVIGAAGRPGQFVAPGGTAAVSVGLEKSQPTVRVFDAATGRERGRFRAT